MKLQEVNSRERKEERATQLAREISKGLSIRKTKWNGTCYEVSFNPNPSRKRLSKLIDDAIKVGSLDNVETRYKKPVGREGGLIVSISEYISGPSKGNFASRNIVQLNVWTDARLAKRHLGF